MRPLARAGCARWPVATPAPSQRNRTQATRHSTLTAPARARGLSSLRSQLAEGVLLTLTRTVTLTLTPTLTLTLTHQLAEGVLGTVEELLGSV